VTLQMLQVLDTYLRRANPEDPLAEGMTKVRPDLQVSSVTIFPTLQKGSNHHSAHLVTRVSPALTPPVHCCWLAW
jgi:hypothetical protein